MNILEELKSCFNKLQEDIDNVQKQLVYYENIHKALSKEIQDLEMKKSENYSMICKVETKLERLNSIYANTEQNFNQVQNAAKSLLDIMQTKDEDEDDDVVDQPVSIHIEDDDNEDEDDKMSTSLTIDTNTQNLYDNSMIIDDENEIILGESSELDLND